MTYFDAGQFMVPLNAKAGSSSMVIAIIKRWHPAIYHSMATGHYPEGKTLHDVQWHSLCPELKQATRPVVIGIRNPIDRFCSGVAHFNVTVEMALDSLLNGTVISKPRRTLVFQNDIHFAPQIKTCRGETHLFRFPEHVNEMAELLDLEEFPQVNIASRPKPVLTIEETTLVADHYAEDMDLYQSITHPNTIRWFPVPDLNTDVA